MAKLCCGAIRKYFKIFGQLSRVLQTDPEVESLSSLSADSRCPQPILWPFRNVGSALWRLEVASYGLLTINLILSQLCDTDLLNVFGVVNLVAALPPDYRGLFAWNYAYGCLLGVVINLILEWHRRSGPTMTFYSVVESAGEIQNLRHLAGLYSDAERLHLWRLTLATHYCGLIGSPIVALPFVSLNTSLLISQLHQNHPLVIGFWILAYLPMAIDAGCQFHSLALLTWLQIYFYAHRATLVANKLTRVSRKIDAEDNPLSVVALSRQILTLSHDWRVVKDEFTAQSSTMNAMCAFVIGLVTIGVHFWIYFFTHQLNGSHVIVLIIAAMLGPAFCVILLSVSCTAPRLFTARRRFVTALYSLQASDRLGSSLRAVKLSSTYRLKCYVLRLIQLEADASHSPSKLAARCGPLFEIKYHVMGKLICEMAAVYLLFSRIINQSINQINNTVY